MAALEYSTDQTAEVVGKPEASFFLEAVREFGCGASACVMIGDVSRYGTKHSLCHDWRCK